MTRGKQKKKNVSRDCLQNLVLHFIPIITSPIVKNSHILANSYFVFLKKRLKTDLKFFDRKFQPQSKYWKNYYQIRQI